ncbi:hypothetical protein PABG_11758 [Paracoccidioides brasiliensis Pb03]|nr:hypothetical protein PABG_11758 [Paracoccidioides brasiliensis Pb03]
MKTQTEEGTKLGGEGEDSPEAWKDGVSRVRLFRNIAKEDQETASTAIAKNAKNGMRRIE